MLYPPHDIWVGYDRILSLFICCNDLSKMCVSFICPLPSRVNSGVPTSDPAALEHARLHRQIRETASESSDSKAIGWSRLRESNSRPSHYNQIQDHPKVILQIIGRILPSSLRPAIPALPARPAFLPHMPRIRAITSPGEQEAQHLRKTMCILEA